MWAPLSITARHHDEELALPRAANPQREPEILPIAKRHRVATLARDRPQLHQPDLRRSCCAPHRVVVDAPPLFPLLLRRRGPALVSEPALEQTRISSYSTCAF
jgi:hypothetical protein